MHDTDAPMPKTLGVEGYSLAGRTLGPVGQATDLCFAEIKYGSCSFDTHDLNYDPNRLS